MVEQGRAKSQAQEEEQFEITLPGDHLIVMKRTFDAPRALVFEAWTKPEHVSRWWDPSGIPLAACEIDLRPNGLFRWVHRAPEGGEGYVFTGAYQEIDPPQRIVFTVRMFPSGPEPVGTITLAEYEAKTYFTLTIECHSKRDRDSLLEMRIDAGTSKTLRNLAEYLSNLR
jgi:uncharacterized protein YndB with AHSA1/START domain